MAVWYLDNDDEITDAVARLRGASDEHVVFVVPPGSRIATGRINFRLLAREAGSRDVRLAIASPDEQVRAMAASAGVVAASSADAATAALERGDEPPASVQPAPVVTGDGEATGAGSAAVAPSTSAVTTQRLAAVTLVVLIVALVAGYAALQTLPTAEVILEPRAVAIGPIEIPVAALPDVTEPDVESGRIPAVSLPIPLSIERTFPATGVESVAAPASGEVVFSSAETFQDIAAGTRVMTPSGVEFRTTELVTLAEPPAGQDVGTVAAPITAVEPGPDGNVAADAISVVPSLEDQGIAVTNPEPTAGGRLEESPRVTAADYDAAAADIQNRLAGALAARLREPDLVPDGLTLFPQTAVSGSVSHAPVASELVGSGTETFSLTGSLDATVLAVDTRLVEHIARARLATALPDGMTWLDDAIVVEVDAGQPDGQRIRFDGRIEGVAYRPVETETVAARIAGLPISEARAILEPIGKATVTVWPEFLADLPVDTDRIALDVREPSTTE